MRVRERESARFSAPSWVAGLRVLAAGEQRVRPGLRLLGLVDALLRQAYGADGMATPHLALVVGDASTPLQSLTHRNHTEKLKNRRNSPTHRPKICTGTNIHVN